MSKSGWAWFCGFWTAVVLLCLVVPDPPALPEDCQLARCSNYRSAATNYCSLGCREIVRAIDERAWMR